jgi:hypothetical protein
MTQSARDTERQRAHDETGRCAFEAIKDMVDALRQVRKALEDTASDNLIDAQDKAERTIHEDPLSVLVRDGWRKPAKDHSENGPEEYEILLSTGGPATRIIGTLNEHCEPETARLEVQDWFVPWQEWRGKGWSEDVLLDYARCFYFGE